MVNLVPAVRGLREHLRESQQAFATRLGVSIRAVANYEKDREPTGKSLVALHRAARASGNTDLAEKFWVALHEELGLSHDAARKIDDADAEVSNALGRLKLLLLEADNLTPAQRKILQRVESKLAAAVSILDALDPYCLTPLSESEKK